ncbi:hypothetical protein NKH77_03565 [Streptomyces sp. M19]
MTVRPRDREGDRAERDLTADLVIDASGRGSRAPGGSPPSAARLRARR